MLTEMMVNKYVELTELAANGEDITVGQEMGDFDLDNAESSEIIHKMRDWIDASRSESLKTELQILLADIQRRVG